MKKATVAVLFVSMGLGLSAVAQTKPASPPRAAKKMRVDPIRKHAATKKDVPGSHAPATK